MFVKCKYGSNSINDKVDSNKQSRYGRYLVPSVSGHLVCMPLSFTHTFSQFTSFFSLLCVCVFYLSWDTPCVFSLLLSSTNRKANPIPNTHIHTKQKLQKHMKPQKQKPDSNTYQMVKIPSINCIVSVSHGEMSKPKPLQWFGLVCRNETSITWNTKYG